MVKLKICKYAYLRNFQFAHFQKLKIDFEGRFEMKMPLFLFNFLVKMKWMDRQSITEIGREVFYEMDRQTKCQKMEIPLKWIRFFTSTRMCYYIWSVSVAFPYFLHLSVYPFQRHVLFPFLSHLVCPSISEALPLFRYYWERENDSTRLIQ